MRKRFMGNKLGNSMFCIMLVMFMALTIIGCTGKEQINDTQQQQSDPISQEKSDQNAGSVLGEGQTVFNITVVDKDGNETSFEIHTDKKMVGEALLDHELIAGEDSEYGLYVKQVNGITADFDTDGSYWAFYINGEYATTGVDTTEIKDGDTYSFKVEK